MRNSSGTDGSIDLPKHAAARGAHTLLRSGGGDDEIYSDDLAFRGGGDDEIYRAGNHGNGRGDHGIDWLSGGSGFDTIDAQALGRGPDPSCRDGSGDDLLCTDGLISLLGGDDEIYRVDDQNGGHNSSDADWLSGGSGFDTIDVGVDIKSSTHASAHPSDLF